MANKNSGVNWFRATLAHEFHLYRNLVAEMEANIEAAHGQLSDTFRTNLQDSLSGPEIALHESIVDYRHAELTHFNRVLMNSLLVSSFSLFESLLFQTCERAKKLSGNPISVSDWGNFSMDRAKRYLELLGVDVPASSVGWKEAKDIQKVRNAIVHGGGILKPESDVVGYAVDQNIAEVSGKDEPLEIWATRAFCEKSLDNFRSLWLAIDQATDDGFATADDQLSQREDQGRCRDY